MTSATDINDHLKQMRAMYLMVEGVGPVSVAQLADLGATVAERYLPRADDAKPPPLKAEPNPPPISADGGDQLDEADEVVSQLEDRLKEAEAAQQSEALEATLTRLEERDAALAARSEAIQAALDNNDVAALAELLGEELDGGLNGIPRPRPRRPHQSKSR